MPTQYVNKPGGVIAHRQDGTSVQLKWGEPVPDDLADHVDASTFSDGKQRLADGDLLALEQERAAHTRAALTENGQVNSSSSPVPSNYSDLDEDAAVQLVQNLGRFPSSQAQVLLHERLYGGNRQKVIDAGSEVAQAEAGAIQAVTTPATNDPDALEGETSVASLGDPFAGVDTAAAEKKILDAAQEQIAALRAAASGEQLTPGPSSGGSDDGPGEPSESWKREDLDKAATEAGVENPQDLPNKQAVVDAINATKS